MFFTYFKVSFFSPHSNFWNWESHQTGGKLSYFRKKLFFLLPISRLGALGMWDNSEFPPRVFLDKTGSMNADCEPGSELAHHSNAQGSCFYSLHSVMRLRHRGFLSVPLCGKVYFPFNCTYGLKPFGVLVLWQSSFLPKLGCFICSLSGT